MGYLASAKWPTAAKEPCKHLLRTDLVLPPSTSTTAASAAPSPPKPTGSKRILLPSTLEPTIGVRPEPVKLVPLLLIAQHRKRPRNHLEGLVGVLMAVFVRVREQRLLAVGLLDIRVRTRRPHGFQSEDVVECRRLACSDSQHGGFLLDCVLALLVALVVLAIPGAAGGGGCPCGFCVGHISLGG
jgi:hypothetical protein